MPSNPALRVAANLAELRATLAARTSQIEHDATIMQAVQHVTAAMADLAASFSGDKLRTQVRAV
jgi:hypothetical protein